MTEQRVVASKPKIGARPSTPSVAPEPVENEGKGKGGKKKLLIIALVVLMAAGAAYWFLLKPAPPADGAVAVEPAPEPGEVLVVEPISINLADGHYLRIGLGLQLTADVAEEPDTARALDIVVALFSQRPMAEVATTEGREALKAELAHQLEETYEGEVMGVYFTDYVTQ